MRTTLTLYDDLAALLRQRAASLGVSSSPCPKTIPHSFGFRPGIDLDKLNQLADELEAEAGGAPPADAGAGSSHLSRPGRGT